MSYTIIKRVDLYVELTTFLTCQKTVFNIAKNASQENNNELIFKA